MVFTIPDKGKKNKFGDLKRVYGYNQVFWNESWSRSNKFVCVYNTSSLSDLTVSQWQLHQKSNIA